MNNHGNGGSDNAKTYYDILEVPSNADASTIRKSYLKKSLKYHPDKNPSNEAEAKEKFIEIGEAYAILSDPAKRRLYDQELRTSGGKKPSVFGKNFHGAASDAQAYDKYMDVFDATVTGMSEAELAAAIGTISTLAGIVGSIVGSRVLGGDTSGRQRGHGSRAPKGSFLSSAGSLVGGLVASEIASSSVRALHNDSINRLNYKEECRRAVERGESVPEPPKTSFIGSKIGDAIKSTINTITTDDSNSTDSFKNSNQNNSDSSNSPHEQSSGSTFENMWRMAAAGVKAAQATNRR